MEDPGLTESVADYFRWWNRAVPELLPWSDEKRAAWLAERQRDARDFVYVFLNDSPVTAVARAIMRDCGWSAPDWPYSVQSELERTIEQQPRSQACYEDPEYDWAAARERIRAILVKHGRAP